MTETTMSVSIGELLPDHVKRELRVAVEAEQSERKPTTGALGLVEKLSSRWSTRTLAKLAAKRGSLAQGLKEVPDRMHLAANQTQLVLELIDDVKSGTYRSIPWRYVAMLSAIALYAVSPADIVPDFIPVLGSLDDVVLMALATRIAGKQLRAYCSFKGYPAEQYFGAEA
jgi:uncharacterized membrane protein YkvA (DUF1232 family)